MKDIVGGWKRFIKKQILFYKEKEPNDFTPLAEYDYWFEIESEISSLLEQMRNEFVLEILKKLETFDESYVKQFRNYLKSVYDYHKLVKENLEYLHTLKDYLIV